MSHRILMNRPLQSGALSADVWLGSFSSEVSNSANLDGGE